MRRALFALLLLAAACGKEESAAPPASALVPASAPATPGWDTVVASARGTTVTWQMWRGDPSINKYVDEWVAPRLRDRYGITLNAVDAQGGEILNGLVLQRDARRAVGTVDLVWINGETFFNLRRERLLHGPWAARLPNAVYVDSASPIISRDFEQTPDGYESPWGRVQFALIYDSVRTPEPPRSFAELRQWILAHPGRFTYDQEFGGVTFLKMLMYATNGGAAVFAGGFNEARYGAGSDSVFAWLAGVQPALWRKGESYPPDVAAMHRLFANREIDFTMSNNENDVLTKVRQGILPATSRALVLRDGTIANSHFLGIPFNAPGVAGAMVVADFLLSPEAQLEKLRPEVWADGTVLAPSRLPAEWRSRFAAQQGDARAVPHDTLVRYAVPEVNPQYHVRLQADWRTRVRRRAN